MKIIYLFILLPLMTVAQNLPPINYIVKNIKVEDSDHVFLNFQTGTTSVKTQQGWDIALYNEAHEIGGKINETNGVRAWRVFRDTTQFSSLSLSDTSFSVSNSESIFYLGALDTLYSGKLSTFFNIGIGDFYLGSDYVAVATKMYIIKKEDNSYGKFYISYKASSNREFTIRYSDIDNSNPRTIVVPKISPLAKHYRYIKLSDGTISNDFEITYNDWDIMFRKYKVGSTTYPIGILTNNAHNIIRLSSVEGFPENYLGQGVVKTECYEAIGDVATVQYNNSLHGIEVKSRKYNQIGERWYNTSGQPVTGRSYFLKDHKGVIWHLVMTSYDAASKTLNIAYQQKATNSILSSKEGFPINIYQLNHSLVLEQNLHTNQSYELVMIDMLGREVYHSNFTDKIAVDIEAYRNQFIIIQLKNENDIQTLKYRIP